MCGGTRHGWCAVRNRIKELRARYEMTQGKLAEVVGVRRETIGHMEKGRYNPSLLLAHRVARALHTTVDELFTFEEET
ncbi:MAG: helix-turn-helix transcriptional regulator [Thermoplasmata archaeon]|nr:helix-turn-helix transcriptional regulator [Thermoplasmata archaeon]